MIFATNILQRMIRAGSVQKSNNCTQQCGNRVRDTFHHDDGPCGPLNVMTAINMPV